MIVTVHPATVRDASYIAANMRPSDVHELRAMGEPIDDPVMYGSSMVLGSDWAFVCKIDGQPASAYGFMRNQQSPWLMYGWSWGTRLLPRTIPAMTETHERIRREMALEGVRRIEVRMLGTEGPSHRWLSGSRMRFHRDCVLQAYGRSGEDYTLYSYTRFGE